MGTAKEVYVLSDQRTAVYYCKIFCLAVNVFKGYFRSSIPLDPWNFSSYKGFFRSSNSHISSLWDLLGLKSSFNAKIYSPVWVPHYSSSSDQVTSRDLETPVNVISTHQGISVNAQSENQYNNNAIMPL